MYKRNVLKNGIRVVSEHIPYVNSISIGIWIKSGSRLESLDNNGMSHFIEHMMFKGTSNRSSKQIAEEIEELGGQINAFTGKEATCFYVKMLDEHYNVGIDVLCDMVLNPKFSKSDIEKEKSVIHEEINMYEDSPEDLVSDILSFASWGENSLSYPILGTEGTVKNFNYEKLIDYFNKTYTPQNIVISIAGNFNEEDILYTLNNKFSRWETHDNVDIVLSSPELNKNIIVKNKDIEQVHVALTMKGIELGNEKLYSLLAVNNYFGGGTSSRLFQRIREEHGYVYTIYSYPSSYKNAGVFNIYFALNEQYIENAVSLIYEEIDSILKYKMTDIQIKKSKEQLKGNYILGLESISSRMFGMGKSELMLSKVFEPKEILNKIDSITTEDIHDVIENVFSKGVISAAAVGRNVDDKNLKKILWR
jgi:predicted Zn-dependent peptidase